MDISVVSGTYNRLPLLQRMVDSARASLAGVFGLQGEFVLVDGGSSDSTIAWCKGQPDVRLIEHGELRGAIKAFNDGAYAAAGDYVLLANDDVEFVGDSILQAWVYLQDHPDCGVACFYQDRGGKGWHVEPMPAVRDGKQVFEPYGQVCLVPKWLGDMVGWWCREDDYRSRGLNPPRTYGGDNELSAKVYEQGYKVSPVPEARIHDNSPDDELRRVNNITGGKDPKAVHGHHPDSWAWGQRWRDRTRGLAGPKICDVPLVPNPLPRRERTLYLPIYEPGWAVQKEQKRGLRDALAKVGPVVEYDYMSRHQAVGRSAVLAEVLRLASRLKPTLVLTQLHNADILDAAAVRLLRNAAVGAKFVNWNGDVWEKQILNEVGVALAKEFDLQTTVNRSALEQLGKSGVNAAYWQIGWEPDGRGCEPGERHDVVFLASGYSQSRHILVQRLRNMRGVTFGLYGQGWPQGWTKGQNLYNFRDACRVYRGARISVGDSQWPESGFVSNRVFQALAAGGAALAHQWFDRMEELGLEDGKTVIVWKSVQELEDKIRHYLGHEGERAKIAAAGEQLALERHSFDRRVQELFALVGGRTQRVEENWRW